jgi:hypothetical protein
MGDLFYWGETYVLRRPGTLIDPRVETVIPSLPALVAVAGADGLGDLTLARAVLLNRLSQLLVLLSCPGALANRACNAVVPPLAAVLVIPSREMRRDLVPADGAILWRLWIDDS